ncbi:type ISP restriction/modification enzyme [Candidatus Spongiisocius sp.]|uniref:type ISP restriction/modification enzyme n=1 Tax=Candidatus Spongiisocius sp. TaxID=3101273 RepID=UPI003B5A03B8
MEATPLTLIDLPSDEDNITDWCLEQFHSHYGDKAITKDDIWEYLYGVMHAPDWRERYRHDLQRNLPRVPFAPAFEAFRAAGQRLMDLHVDYETVPEWPLECLVDGHPDEGDSDPDAYRITRNKKMRWGKSEDSNTDDRTVFMINDRCKLVGIPEEAHQYTVSGRTPLDWAIDSLRWKTDRPSQIVDDPNGWHAWSDEPFNLIRHLRRLVYVSVETSRIVNGLPPSLVDT